MTIKLFGEIVSDDWVWLYDLFGIPYCCPKQVRDAIQSLPAGEDLILEINSPGGDVWAGFEIYGMLQACRANTEAHIIPMAASAASTVMCGCDRVLASPVAQIMVHQPAAYVEEYVNNDGAKHLQNYLDSIKASILNGYVIKSAGKASRKKFEQLMDDSTYMPAQTALELGLVDGYLDLDDEAAAAITMSGGVHVSNAAGISPSPKALLARYEAAVRDGMLAAVPGHPVPAACAAACAAAPETSMPPQRIYGGAETMNAGTADMNDLPDVDLIGDWHLMAAIDLERARM